MSAGGCLQAAERLCDASHIGEVEARAVRNHTNAGERIANALVGGDVGVGGGGGVDGVGGVGINVMVAVVAVLM